jgi:hypothetical protein
MNASLLSRIGSIVSRKHTTWRVGGGFSTSTSILSPCGAIECCHTPKEKTDLTAGETSWEGFTRRATSQRGTNPAGMAGRGSRTVAGEDSAPRKGHRSTPLPGTWSARPGEAFPYYRGPDWIPPCGCPDPLDDRPCPPVPRGPDAAPPVSRSSNRECCCPQCP